jgi:PAS domain S-box-containing protein
MKLSLLSRWLNWIQEEEAPIMIDIGDDDDGSEKTSLPTFVPAKRLCERDYIIIDMLNSQGHDAVSFCVTDPHQTDNPVIHISAGFSKLTGWDYDDVVGRNCRFLQGPDTSEDDSKRIRDAIIKETDCSVNLLNYKKDGTKFINEVSVCFVRCT